MNIRTGILYASIDGQTLKICERLKDILVQHHHAVELHCIDSFNNRLAGYDKFIIGSSIRYGKHNAQMIDFIKRNKNQLEGIKTAFFSVNLVARKSDKNTPETNPYVVKFLRKVPWRPDEIAVFAGKLNYKLYSPVDKLMIQLIMLISGGPVNRATEIEYTDWKKVGEFGNVIVNM